jgi:hypothetical protein
MPAGSNSRECFTEFIGQRVVGVLFDALPLHHRDIADGTKTLVFEDGRGLTITARGSFWVSTADEVQRAVKRKVRDLKATESEIQAVLDLAGVSRC